MTATPPHLGGHMGITHTDRNALRILMETYPPINSMLDVGCGPGGMLDLAKRAGLIVVGIDGDNRIHHGDVICHDFTFGPLPVVRRFDLVWSVEFVEHVEAQYEDNFLQAFTAGRVIFMTHALPGQPGHHHVNCQEDQYWIDRIEALGYRYDADTSQRIRKAANDPYIQQSALVFVRL